MGKNHLKLIWRISALVLLASCCHKPVVPERISTKAWQMTDAVRECNIRHMDTAVIRRLISLGLFKPNADCTDSVTVNASYVPHDPEQAISSVFLNGNTHQKVNSLCAYLYASVPELYIDNANHYAMNYQIDKQNVYTLLNNLQRSKEAALCSQYATLVKTLLELNLHPGYTTAADIYDSTDVTFHHIVCLFYYKENDTAFGTVIDAMYGYIFPSENGKTLSLPDLSAKKSDMKGCIAFLPDSTLAQKRFLTDSIWPCNFLTENVYSYNKGLPGSLKKYELHQAEDIRLLSMQPLDTVAYTWGLYKVLQKNKPEGY